MDESSTLTNTAQVRYHTTITTDGNGAAAFNATFVPSTILRKATTIVSDAITVDGSYASSNDATYIDTHAHLRVVTFAVRVYCIANADKAQGILRVASNLSAINTVDFSSSNDTSVYIPITKDLDITWTMRSLGRAIHNFIPTDSSLSTLATAGTMPCTVPDFFLSGGPASSAVLGVEVRVNYELLPDETDIGTYRHATSAWPSIPQLTKHVANYLANSPAVKDTAEIAAGAAVASAGPGVYASIEAFLSAAGESAVEMAPLLLL